MLYVEELVGWETISTMPEETIRAFQDHGRVEPRVESNLDDAVSLLAALTGAGVDYDESSPNSSVTESRNSPTHSRRSSLGLRRSGEPAIPSAGYSRS
jgi:hypothetical protein